MRHNTSLVMCLVGDESKNSLLKTLEINLRILIFPLKERGNGFAFDKKIVFFHFSIRTDH